VLILAAALAAAFAASAAQLPADLQQLESIKDKAALVQAVRDYDKQATAAATEDLTAAKELAKNGKKDEAKAKYDAGVAKLQAVDQAYKYALAQFPKNAKAHNYYGELLYDYLGEDAGAIKEWNLANSLDPQLSAPYNNLGIYYFHTGQYQMGLDAYEKALALEPNHPDYLYNLSNAYLLYFPQIMDLRKWKKAKVYKEAMKLSKKAAEADPKDYELARDYAMNFFQAESFDVKADWDKAAEAWVAARNLAGTDAERFNAWLNEGRAWIKAGNKAKATECLNEAAKLMPESEVPKRLLKELDNPPAQPPKGSVFPKGKVKAVSS
jgi:tetratricopeptide (TPR) repeat protein